MYTIPLGDIGVAKTKIYKFAMQDQTGLSNNVFYVDDVAFVGKGARDRSRLAAKIKNQRCLSACVRCADRRSFC